MKFISGIAVFSLLSMPFWLGAAEEPQVKITVEAGKVVAAVNPLGFGNNMEAADGRGIFGEKHDAPTFNLNGVKFGQGFWDPVKNAPQPKTTAEAAPLRIGMMRYPGGCLAHNFNWKQAVGPLSERPDWKFGIDQYIELCRKMNWEPVITLTDFAMPKEELPQHVAELVEYLNAPATPEHPWAMKRAEWGHKEPYGVKYFELGNESDHGSHHTDPRRTFTPEEYVKYALDSMKLIRRIDPTVKLGILTVPGNGLDYDCEWNKTVIKGAGKEADFLIVHYYGPGIGGLAPRKALNAVLAYPDQLVDRMANYRRLTKELTGRELPLAVTEYNIGGSGNEPVPYRYTYLAGLMCAELMRLWQLPENKVEFANYWHILNGWWGAYYSNETTGEISRRYATLPFFEAWGKYRGDEIVKVDVENSPRVSVSASAGLLTMRGDTYLPPRKFKVLDKFNFKFPKSDAVISETPVGNNGFDVVFKNAAGNRYDNCELIPRATELKDNESMLLTVSFDARFLPEKGSESCAADFGIGLCDTRGWDATSSAIAITGVQNARDWKHFSKTFSMLGDAQSADLLFRIENPGKPISGKAEFRNIKAEIGVGATYPAYPAISAFATRSKDGKKLYLIVFNKDPEKAVTATIKLDDFKAVSGNSLELYQEKVESVDYFKGRESAVALKDGGFTRSFPAHSMSAFEFSAE